jgi:tRNA (cmo5U34)-methyltransferase
MTTHSVERHLEVTPTEYDVEIRRFVPGYDTMLQEVIGALKEHLPMGPSRVIDLGAGTGALTERILAELPDVRVMLLDADAEMLARAESRLDGKRDRVQLMHGSFGEPFPHVHAAVASLSLHHVHDRAEKCAVYTNILGSLREGGILVNADATMPEATALATPLRRRWAAHLVANGDTEAQAFERFARWAMRDRYFGIDEEIEMMRESGFTEIDVRWRFGPTTVIVGRKVEGRHED